MKNIIMVIITGMLLNFQGAYAETTGNEKVKVKITSGNMEIFAILNNTSPAKDLVKRLPLTLKMNPHQNREYYANIRLDKKDMTQNNYQIGDIGYWTTGNSLVLFYAKGHTSDLIIMGKIISRLDELANMKGDFQALIERTDDLK